MRIKHQLLFVTTFIAIIAVILASGIIGYLSYKLSKEALKQNVQNHLTSIQELKKEQVENYFKTIRAQVLSFSDDKMISTALESFKSAFEIYGKEIGENNLAKYKKADIEIYLEEFSNRYKEKNISALPSNTAKLINLNSNETFALQYFYIFNNKFSIGQKARLDEGQDNTTYSKVHNKFHPFFRDYLEKFNFYDMFLVGLDGVVYYTKEKKVDFTSSLIDGPFADSQLAKVFNMAKASPNNDFSFLSDFKPYIPSYGDEVAFIATPIFKEGIKIGVLIFQIHQDVINNILVKNKNLASSWMGKTGEVYIVGEDNKLRTENRLFLESPNNYAEIMESYLSKDTLTLIKTKHTTIGLQKIISPDLAVDLNQTSNYKTIEDFLGHKYLASVSPLSIEDLKWEIVCSISKEEALAGINTLGHKIYFSSLILMVVLVSLSFIMGKRLVLICSEPIEKISDEIQYLAKHQDLTKRLQVTSNDEIGEMASSLNGLLANFQHICMEALQSSKLVKNTLEEISLFDKNEKNQQPESKTSISNEEKIKHMKNIMDAATNLGHFSDKLTKLSEQFKIIEEQAEQKSEW
ncbi:MAG: methyl-accepting chemotaxis sensory transducer [Francisellaceae bacterium]|nr:methyl-accepting chemotaxis sensory transducer [Francisellaceae bacterium]